jgi:carboxylesterase type B
LALSFTGNAPVDPDIYANITVTPVAREILHIIDESGVNQNEDCLALNVWTQPQSGESSKAVMVWIHGGGYVTGEFSSLSEATI